MTATFRSCLANDLERFLEFKHALGHSYRRAAFTLRSFDRFVHEHVPPRSSPAFDELVPAWLAQRPSRKAVSIATDLAPVRQFFLFRRRVAPGGFVPGRDYAPQSTESRFVPHVFALDEIRAILKATDSLRGPPFRGLTVRMLLLLLYCTGLRFGEALRLRLADVDLRRRVLTIRESKGKTRLVPFREDLGLKLRAYRRERDLIGSPLPGETLLVQPSGRACGIAASSGMVRRLLRRIGLKPQRGRVGPRPYDLRATFAVHRLLRWHRNRADLAVRLPWLSAYMGHVNLLGTEVYLRATPELMALASRRLHTRLRTAQSVT